MVFRSHSARRCGQIVVDFARVSNVSPWFDRFPLFAHLLTRGKDTCRTKRSQSRTAEEGRAVVWFGLAGQVCRKCASVCLCVYRKKRSWTPIQTQRGSTMFTEVRSDPGARGPDYKSRLHYNEGEKQRGGPELQLWQTSSNAQECPMCFLKDGGWIEGLLFEMSYN